MVSLESLLRAEYIIKNEFLIFFFSKELNMLKILSTFLIFVLFFYFNAIFSDFYVNFVSL